MGEKLARAVRSYFRRPRVVLQLALLAALLSAAIIVLMAVGSAQLLVDEGSEALPMVYLLLAAVSVPLASGISAALCRWSVTGISGGASIASLFLALSLWAALALELARAALAVCIVAYALEIVFDTLFWLSASEHLPTLELKRHTPFLSAAFALGGIVTGFIATAFCEILAGQDLLLLDAAFFALCAVQYRRIGRLLVSHDASEAEEAKPSLTESMKATLGVVRAFPITGAIAASVLLMSALFCLQDYLAMTVYQEAFSDADELSSFMAIVYAGHQAAELLILAGCGRFILERVGPVVRNMIFPATTLAGLVALLGFWNLATAVFVHANVIALSNAVFEPVKTLNFAAVPYRVLAHVRMLVDGVLYPLGVALSALALLWLQNRTDSQVVLAVSITVAAVFVGVSAMVGALFLPNLLRSLRLRAISPWEYARAGSGRVFSAGDIRQLLNHPDAEARHFGVDLAQRLAPELLPVAAPAGSCVSRVEDQSTSWPMPTARAEAASADPAPEEPVQLREGDFAAVGERPATMGLRTRSQRGSARSRRADARISRLAMIGRKPSPTRLNDIGHGLENPSLAIRRASAGVLARFGAAGVPIAAAYLHSVRPEVVEAAIQALGGTGTRRGEQLLREYLGPLYLRAQVNLDALDAIQRMAEAPDGHRRAVEAWLIDANRWIVRRALFVKSALGNPRDIKLLELLTRAREPRIRSDAIEALVNLPTKRFIQPLVPLLEAGSDQSGAPDSGANRKASPGGAALTLKKAATDNSWARLLVARLIDHKDRGNETLGDEAMLDLILFLKTSSLFRGIPLEGIARVAQLAQPVSRNQSEQIADAGDPIRHVYVVRSGAVELRLNDKTVEVIGPGASFGEGAVFGEDRHGVSFRASSPLLLLRFPVSVIADLVVENPEALSLIALDLSTRLNRLRAQLAAVNEPSNSVSTSRPTRARG